MIPVLAIPVLNRPDLLGACVASIDADVERLVIIDNSPTGGMGDVAEAAMPDNIREIWVTEPPGNLGYTASVNFAIRTHPKAPWWCIANADTVFAAGDLDRLAASQEEPGPRWTGVVDWRVFGLNQAAVAAAGLWDECFFNYCSDADYEYRCQLAGVPIVRLAGETTHIGSVCYQGDPRYAAHNVRSYPIERRYYAAKWGGDLRGGERFTTPFDLGGDVRDWRLDVGRLAEEVWD